jgi:hypothetical protein
MRQINTTADGTVSDLDLEGLRRLTVRALRARHLDVVGTPSRSSSRQFLIRRIAWELQAQREGRVAIQLRQRAREIAAEAPVRLRSWKHVDLPAGSLKPECAVMAGLRPRGDDRLPMPGTLLVKEHDGQTIVVKVLDHGFEYNQQVFSSLSALALHITGTKWNGYLFFGLTGGKRDKARTAMTRKDQQHARG